MLKRLLAILLIFSTSLLQGFTFVNKTQNPIKLSNFYVDEFEADKEPVWVEPQEMVTRNGISSFKLTLGESLEFESSKTFENLENNSLIKWLADGYLIGVSVPIHQESRYEIYKRKIASADPEPFYSNKPEFVSFKEDPEQVLSEPDLSEFNDEEDQREEMQLFFQTYKSYLTFSLGVVVGFCAYYLYKKKQKEKENEPNKERLPV